MREPQGTPAGSDRALRCVTRTMAAADHVADQTAPVDVRPADDADLDAVLRLRLASGAIWTFLWEGAAMRIEDSVRQSSYFGFHRIKQIVLEAPLGGDQEIAWIFTLDEHRRGIPQQRLGRRRIGA